MADALLNKLKHRAILVPTLGGIDARSWTLVEEFQTVAWMKKSADDPRKILLSALREKPSAIACGGL